MRVRFFSFLLLLLLPTHLFSTLNIWAGPEICYLERKRVSGTHQEGALAQIHVCAERIKRYGWYVALDYLYGLARIRGANRLQHPVLSDFSNQIVEGRLGYCLQKNDFKRHIFIPFLGFGKFCQIHDFVYPSDPLFLMKESFNFFAVGFLASLNYSSLLSIGLNFKIRLMHHSICTIKNDPFFDDFSMIIKDSTHYRLELPITYHARHTPKSQISLTPLFEYRHFGGRESYPFDYVETQYFLYGANFRFIHGF